MVSRFFFFFQAEDGIRDKLVTGVQTCALPICHPAPLRVPRAPPALGETAFLVVHKRRKSFAARYPIGAGKAHRYLEATRRGQPRMSVLLPILRHEIGGEPRAFASQGGKCTS